MVLSGVDVGHERKMEAHLIGLACSTCTNEGIHMNGRGIVCGSRKDTLIKMFKNIGIMICQCACQFHN